MSKNRTSGHAADYGDEIEPVEICCGIIQYDRGKAPCCSLQRHQKQGKEIERIQIIASVRAFFVPKMENKPDYSNTYDQPQPDISL